MIRRQFIKNTTAYSITGLICGWNPMLKKNLKDVVIGHNSHQYKVDLSWGQLNQQQYPVNDCHEMVIDSKGRIILLTNHTQNNIIIYDQKGKLIEVWGTEFPGAHGLTLKVENGEDLLYISDNNRHEIIKTTIEGKVIQIFPYPKESGKYDEASQYVPTETAVTDNGDVYVADGYGLQYILHYNSQGTLLNVFGGKGNDNHQFTNAHGICIDNRGDKNILLITDRMKNQLKRFTLDGKLISIIDLPGAFICRPVIHKDHVYLATIWSGNGAANSGFISILNKEDQLISAPGGSLPNYQNEQLQTMHQTMKIFKHPHDVCVDNEENLYVAQWNAGKSYPIKLLRV